MHHPRPQLYAGLSIVCCSLLTTEVLFTRIFSVCLMHHFAFFAISIAMFGLGLGGVCAQVFYRRPGHEDEGLAQRLSSLALLLAVTSLLTPALLFNIRVLGFAVMAPGADVAMSLWLALVFVLSSLPFLCGGIITSLLFRDYSGHISGLYFADLIGASLGCLLAIALVEFLGAPTALLADAVLAGLGALCFLLAAPRRSPRRSALSAFVVASLAGLFVLNLRTPVFDIRYAKGIDRRPIDEFSGWNSISRVSVSRVLSDAKIRRISRDVWGVSGRFQGSYPPVRMITIDADAGTMLTRYDGDLGRVGFVRADPPSLVHRLKKAPRTLIIGAGGGKDVLSALSFGARHVTAVELNPIIVRDVMLDRYRDFSGGLYQDPRVRAVAREGRSFVSSSREKFDIIQLAFVDTSAATPGGAYILAENSLYTVEAFRRFLDHLEPGGILSVCWVDIPDLLGATRLVSLAVAALERSGAGDLGRNVAVVSNAARPEWVIRDVLVKKEPFTAQEQDALAGAARDLGFEATYLPRDREKAPSPSSRTYRDFIRLLINDPQARDSFYRTSDLDISPTTDDRPFFFYQIRPKDLLRSLWPERLPVFAGYTSGPFVLMRILIVGLVLAGLCCAVPFAALGRGRPETAARRGPILGLLAYFSCIGSGFMLVEIAMLQKLTLFLGAPLYSVAATLLSLLLSAGLGSLATRRFTSRPPLHYVTGAILGLLLVGAVYLAALPPLLGSLLGHPLPAKMLVAVLVLMPLGFLMGMPLPMAIRHMDKGLNDLVPWMWGVNGATSVLASILAIISAMNLGYSLTLAGGYGCYLLALLAARTAFR
ncbi:MAG: hypothetical protein HY927_02305 [Elusimicrobia bacterium]|nr:hypothetical protein [Elusimicrobiota bacterium]